MATDIKTQVTDFAKQRWADFQKFSAGQKAVTIVAVLALGIGGYFLATWKSEPTYAPLYSNLAATDASSIVGKLDEKGIPYKLTDGGAGITVPTTQVDTARLAVSAAGLPNSGQTGYSLLDKEGVTTSQFKQQIDYQRAVEGELGKTIGSIDGVQSASVHLAIPKDDVFSDGTDSPTAAVMLTVKPGTSLTSSQVQSVVYLVSSSVQGMKTGNVTVTDSSGEVLNSPDGGVSGSANSATQAKAAADYNTRLAASLQSAVDASLGMGHAKVMVNAALDFDESTTKSDKYVYDKNTPAVSEQTSKETYSGNGAGSGGTLGTANTGGSVDANGTNGTSSTGGANGNGGYEKSTSTVNNALGRVTETVQSAPGGIKNQHIAVLLDENAKNLDPTRIESIVKGYSGYDATRGDTLSVETVPFDTSVQDAAAKAAKASAAQAAADKSHAALMSLVKQGVFAILVLALVIGTWRASKKRGNGGASARTPRDSYPDDDTDSDTDLMDELMRHEAAAAARTTPADDANARLAARRRSLGSAADNRPADVADLLSGWLSSKESNR